MKCDVHTLPPVVLSHAFVGLLQGEVMLAGPSPVKGGDGLVPSFLIQNLAVVDEALLQLLAVQKPVHHLKVARRSCGRSVSVRLPRRPGVGLTKRLRLHVKSVGVGAVAGHFNRIDIPRRSRTSGLRGGSQTLLGVHVDAVTADKRPRP